MKIYQYIKFMLVLMMTSLGQKSVAQTPIAVNNTPVIATCTLGSYGNVTIKVPTEALTGDNIPLNITLPATGVGCIKKIIITQSPELNFVSSVTPFTNISTLVYTNASVIDPINGQNFNVFYAFPGGVTCNDTDAKLTVKVEIDCGGTITVCEKTVTVKARAENYWSISKHFVAGNLTCGDSYWRILLTHNNPNGSGLGAYTLSGTVTETTSLPVISPASGTASIYGNHTYNGTYWATYLQLKNCLPQGTILNNTASYNLILGNKCKILTGNLSANAGPLQSPNPSISFTKSAYSNGNVFSQGCQGYYALQIFNNGNVPWTGFSINENLSIAGIIVTSVYTPGWTASTPSFTGPVTFTNPSLVLNPGESSVIYINYDITGSSGSTVTNTASLSYTASGTPQDSSDIPIISSCTGITCPTLSTAILNTVASVAFVIKPKQAIPSIVKCNEPNPYTIPIKEVGTSIKFRIQVANAGNDVLNTIVNDALTTPQNLSVDPSSVSFSYYSNQYQNYCGSLSGTPSSGNTYGSWNNNPTNPTFTISNLPGICDYNRSNILVIEFEANILPQLSGSKINTATMGSQTASANYSIDKKGELKIRKTVDVNTAEIGGAFNYFLTVTNMGSSPLNNIVVTDNLPSCVSINGTIIVKKGNTSVSFTGTTPTITILPSQVINPGESIVIKIPVKKLTGTNCCNDAASATAKMVPDNTLINAITPADQPACVTSNLCCEIPNLVTTLNPVSIQTGVFDLGVYAGVTPIQEIEVSMLDYHVTYTSKDCKPTNMGLFGNIYSPNTMVGGLNLSNNLSQSLSWNIGTPFVLNQKIRLTIVKPTILNLSCCNGTVYFCLKVRVKDVNCKVCEKVVCGRFNIKGNMIIDNPVEWFIDDYELRMIPELKDNYEKTLLDQQIKKDQIDIKALETIENHFKNVEPTKREELFKKLSKNPFDIINTPSIKEGGPLAVPTGGTTPRPK